MISVLIPTRDSIKTFTSTIQSFARLCPDNLRDQAEFVVKVDNDSNDRKRVKKVLKASGHPFRIVASPRGRGYLDLYRFFDQMKRVAGGNIFWLVSDDIEVVSGNWVEELLATRDIVSDNIYVAYAAFAASTERKLLNKYRKVRNGCPAVSKEFYDKVGSLSRYNAQVDEFVKGVLLSSDPKRCIAIKSKIAQMTNDNSRTRGHMQNYVKKRLVQKVYDSIAKEMGIYHDK